MEDNKIIDLYWARKETAIEETALVYGHYLMTLSGRILQNREDAEENVSDTYLKTWNAIPPQRPRFFQAFLSKICRNLALDKLAKQNTLKRNAEVLSITQEMEQCIPDLRIERKMECREIGKTIESFLSGLPKESRLIFLRRYLYLDSVANIAVRYGITESKVKMQLYRTRSKLRIHLEKEGISV